MKIINRYSMTSLIVLFTMPVTLSASQAKARSMLAGEEDIVNVSVSFNTQTQVNEVDEQKLLEMQQSGRTFIYRLAEKECEVLKATIAETCRLRSISSSSQLREQGIGGERYLYLNGSAQYGITLKKKGTDTLSR